MQNSKQRSGHRSKPSSHKKNERRARNNTKHKVEEDVFRDKCSEDEGIYAYFLRCKQNL